MSILIIIGFFILEFCFILIMTNPSHRYDNILDKVAFEVIKGKWGPEIDVPDNLWKAGYDAYDIQKRVSKIKNNPKMLTKTYSIKRFLQLNYRIIVAIICICMLVISYTTITNHQKQNTIGNSELACEISQYTNTEIYHDVESDKYFVIVTNKWDVFNIYSRVYIDNDVAIKVIEATKTINEFTQK